jgi:hypothetical protein
MNIVAAISNIQTSLPEEIIIQNGKFIAISLIFSFFIALLFSDSSYWNKRISYTIDMQTTPLLITFAAIIFYYVISIL